MDNYFVVNDFIIKECNVDLVKFVNGRFTAMSFAKFIQKMAVMIKYIF